MTTTIEPLTIGQTVRTPTGRTGTLVRIDDAEERNAPRAWVRVRLAVPGVTTGQDVEIGYRLRELKVVCPCCAQLSDTIARRRRPTQYRDDESNWLTSCLPCFHDDQDHWHEMIAEYEANLL